MICESCGQAIAPKCGFITLPTNKTGVGVEIYTNDIKEWAKTFPAVYVEGELARMKIWLDANPKKRKTKHGMMRFVTSWLGRQQDRGGVRVEQKPWIKPERVTGGAAPEVGKYDYTLEEGN